ncbi:MAG: molybdopterin-guanine dinucleotide biosynthesis protein B [Chloroflexi bacterium]|nr:molybdopterin-guanine dinucleotide biosynthesis protein B [Chloroflexota bacterium]
MPLRGPPGFPAPVVSVVGRSGVGKTLVMERLIKEFKGRGRRVAAVKHAAHGFQLDRPGTDSWRLVQAGAPLVILTSPGQAAVLESMAGEPDLEALAARYLAGVDLVLVEGYKDKPFSKIEVWWSRVGGALLCQGPELMALVCDRPFDVKVPQFAFEDTVSLANFLEKQLSA